jgi:hypothetical protein
VEQASNSGSTSHDLNTTYFSCGLAFGSLRK